jgi:hypothetical protein
MAGHIYDIITGLRDGKTKSDGRGEGEAQGQQQAEQAHGGQHMGQQQVVQGRARAGREGRIRTGNWLGMAGHIYGIITGLRDGKTKPDRLGEETRH